MAKGFAVVTCHRMVHALMLLLLLVMLFLQGDISGAGQGLVDAVRLVSTQIRGILSSEEQQQRLRVAEKEQQQQQLKQQRKRVRTPHSSSSSSHGDTAAAEQEDLSGTHSNSHDGNSNSSFSSSPYHADALQDFEADEAIDADVEAVDDQDDTDVAMAAAAIEKLQAALEELELMAEGSTEVASQVVNPTKLHRYSTSSCEVHSFLSGACCLTHASNQTL